MFRSKRNDDVRRGRSNRDVRIALAAIESLEGRQFLSGSPFMFHPDGGPRGGHGHGHGPGDHAQPVASITYDQAPTAVQTGLETLVTSAGLADPTSDQSVTLNNVDGVETYTLTINGTGTVTTLTVDAEGNAVAEPTHSTTTWSTLNGSDTGSNTAAATEISAIATALNLTAPADDTTVNVATDSTGNTTYSVLLDRSSDTSSMTDTGFPSRRGGVLVTVDSNGDPVGNQTLPFSVLPTTIQDAINANTPSGATALTSDSTQSVRVRTVDGVTLYSTTFTSTGTSTTVTVNADGELASTPSRSTSTYSDLSDAVKTELQTLATANGVTDSISSDQSVDVLTEGNGTTLYTVALSATSADDEGNDITHDVTLTVDANGNPTTLPDSGSSFAGDTGHHGGHHDFAFGRRPLWSSTPIDIPENFLG